MKHCYRALVLLCTLALLPATALATIGPDIKARILPPTKAVVPGQPVELTVEILSEHAATLERVVLQSEGWDLFGSTAPSVLQAAPQQPALFTVMGIARDLDAGISIQLEKNGRAYELGARVPRPALPGIEQEQLPAAMAPRDARELEEELGRAPASGGPVAAAPYNITVSGNIWYYDQNSTQRPVDESRIDVRDVDTGDGLNQGTLGTTYTNSSGDFSTVISWDPAVEAYPDIAITFWLDNQYVRVTTTGGSLGWGTTSTNDYTGTNLNVGSWTTQLSPDPRPHHFTQNTRVARWFVARGYTHPKVDAYVVSTETTGAFYRGWTSPPEIHYGSNRQWNEDTAAHEYGHHFVRNHAVAVGPDYCNGICDFGGGCGHCIWCQETDHDAFSEGFPNWIADIYTREHTGLYGYATLNTRSQENLSTCSGAYDDPWITEGFLGALCRDMEDSTNDTHGIYSGSDQMAVGKQKIIDFVADRDPTTPKEFLKFWVEEFPGDFAALYPTAQNCGYADTEAPLIPLFTVDDYQGPWDNDATQAISWPVSTDDWTGIDFYRFYATDSAGGGPVEFITEFPNNVFSGVTNPIDTGSWNFGMLCFDRAGNSSFIQLIGPFTIVGPDGADFEPSTPPNWNYPALPREAADATYASAPDPVLLAGNSNSTWFNMEVRNTGGYETVSDNSVHGVYVDDDLLLNGGTGNITPGGGAYIVNFGPRTVPGGRHTLSYRTDRNDTEPEADETNNNWGRQWVWSPLEIPQGTMATRSAPPLRDEGFAYVPAGSQVLHDNVDGLRATGGGDYVDVVAISPVENFNDYDLYLHSSLSTGADSGFDTVDLSSTFAGAGTDGIVFNRNLVGRATSYDLGVLNYGEDSSDYNLEVRAAPAISPLQLYEEETISFDQDQMVVVREIWTPAGEEGVGQVYVDAGGATQGFDVRWFDSATTVASLSQSDAYGFAVAGGAPAVLPLSTTSPNSYSILVVARRMYQGTAPTSVTVKLRGPVNAQLPPYASMVASVYGGPDGTGQPLEQAYVWDGTPGSVPAQEDRSFAVTLRKGTDNTLLTNFPAADIGLGSDGTGGNVAGCDWLLPADGNSDASGVVSFSGTLAGGGTTLQSNRLQVRLKDVPQINWTGDDHVNVLFNSPDINADGTVDLLDLSPFSVDYAGYDYRSDYVRDGKVDLKDLSPFSVAYDTSCPAAIPAAVSTDELADVLRMSSDPAGLVDEGKLAVGSEGVAYLWLTGPAALEGISAWEGRLLHSDNLQVVATDLGRARLDLGEGSEHIVGLGGLQRAEAGSGLQLATVRYRVTDAQPAWLGVGAARRASAGVDLPAVVVGLDETHLRAVALDNEDGMLLRVNRGGAPATGDTPGDYAGLQLGNHPNPFNPATTVQFALPRAGEATVRVFDTAGRLVRTLGPQSFPAGDASLHWDGQDDQGRGVTSGVYFYRFFLDGQPEGGAQRMTLLK